MRTLHVGIRVGDLDRSLGSYTGLRYQVLGEVPETDLGSLRCSSYLAMSS
jgi:lactoylglutathione lyase